MDMGRTGLSFWKLPWARRHFGWTARMMQLAKARRLRLVTRDRFLASQLWVEHRRLRINVKKLVKFEI
jgi:hypothetical protein